MLPDRQCKHCKLWFNRDGFYAKSPRCKACHKIQVTEWRAKNPAKVKGIKAAWTARHADRLYLIRKEYRERPDRKLTQRVHNLNRRSREKNAVGTYTAKDIRAIMETQNGCCKLCGCNIRSEFHIDHWMPLIRGGSNWPSNLQLLCPTCNMRKGDSLPIPLPTF